MKNMKRSSTFQNVFNHLRNFTVGPRLRQFQKSKSHITYYVFTVLSIAISFPLLVNTQAINSPSSAKPKLSTNDEETRLKQCIDEILNAVASSDQVDLDDENRKARGKPWNSYHRITDIPSAVVTPNTTEEVSKIMKICSKYKIPIVPYGNCV